ncbi:MULTISPECIES: monovalent cation/H+ antiporter complex subunit F [Pseudoalteromonas]|uniref:monovalent cation/H+ antiporter complex subunit F n=1 Tax=Pseudoalteromonas TaxID=53246 RepID=UPI000FFF090F|nr:MULTISPECIES: monovalent cation/H+ antiporter complex subunit F [Pseudoalteromonas]MCG9760013.1 monovalent cation/H+ antiporter complex subunit F [Pseudoalteromonas sp. Isolate6]NKC19041.1 multiple resistance and pH regulation protein F [Pseudoalteromonas galatheae]RXE89024.1 multiple resistance and pH regulation protein F [Pseudoalteromonas sp. A757]
MTVYLGVVISILTIVLLLGLLRLCVGSTRLDLISSLQLFGTLGVAVMILLAVYMDQSALFNVALVLALLAPTTTVILVRLGGVTDDEH